VERLMTDRERLLEKAVHMLEFARGDLDRAGEAELAQSLADIQTHVEDLVYTRVVPAP
jgi:hypothetical protein